MLVKPASFLQLSDNAGRMSYTWSTARRGYNILSRISEPGQNTSTLSDGMVEKEAIAVSWCQYQSNPMVNGPGDSMLLLVACHSRATHPQSLFTEKSSFSIFFLSPIFNKWGVK